MNEVHLHLMMNHLPIISPILGLIVLIGGYFFSSEVMKRTGLGLFIIGALFTFPSMFTGDAAEDIAENLSGVSHDVIHHHEEWAEKMALVSYVLGILSVFTLWASWKNKAYSRYGFFGVLVLSFVGIFLGIKTGNSGGEIRHPEITNQIAPASDNDEKDVDE